MQYFHHITHLQAQEAHFALTLTIHLSKDKRTHYSTSAVHAATGYEQSHMLAKRHAFTDPLSLLIWSPKPGVSVMVSFSLTFCSSITVTREKERSNCNVSGCIWYRR